MTRVRRGRAAVEVILAAAVVVFGACGKDEPPSTRATPPSREAVGVFLSEFPKAMAQCAQLPVTRWFDMDLLATRVAAAQPELLRHGTRKDLATGLEPAVPKVLCGQLAAGGSYKLVGMRPVGGASHPVFRIDNAMRGVDYHEIELTAGPDGKARIADVFIASHGAGVSATLADQFLWILKSKDTYAAFVAAHGRRDGAELARIAAALPEELRRLKTVAIMVLEAKLATLDPAIAGPALKDHYARYPDDMAATLLELELALGKDDGQKMLDIVGGLEARFGKDAWLTTLRSLAVGYLGRTEESLELAAQAAEQDPALAMTATHLVGLYLANQQYASAVAALERARANVRGFDEAAFAKFPTWAAFTQTTEYAMWKRAAAAPAPQPP